MHTGGYSGVVGDRAQGNRSGYRQWIVVGAGAERGKGDTFDLVLFGEVEAALVSARQQALIVRAARIDGADGMEDILRGQLACGSYYGAAGGAAADLTAFFHDTRPARAVDGAIHAAATPTPG